MTKLEWALRHARKGFWVFRLNYNGLPARKGWQAEATRDPARIRELWSGDNKDCNIGAFIEKFKSGYAVCVDIDCKDGKQGYETVEKLKAEGYNLPETLGNISGSGGKHMVYSAPTPVKQSISAFKREYGDENGIDIKSRGNYIVMAGSVVKGKKYKPVDTDIAPAPDWLYTRFKISTKIEGKEKVDQSRIDPDKARRRAEAYLEDAPLAEEGSRNDTAYKVACEFKDLGLKRGECLEFMTLWNEKLEEPLEEEELSTLVYSCYRSGQNDIGSKASETIFEVYNNGKKKSFAESEHPFAILNREYALVMAGGGHHIIHETTDEHGEFRLEHYNEQSFHKMHAWNEIVIGKKAQAVTKAWLTDKRARRYQGMVFAPGQEVDERFYNLWRGFTVEPVAIGEKLSKECEDAFEAFIEHTFVNICGRNKIVFDYLMDWAAHMIQKPWEKPGIMPVFRGRKGTGKNVWVERLFALIGPHSLIVDNRRYLTSNFNSHLEGKLGVAFDEGYWAGEKEHEGTLKGLITGTKINIERKGLEPYSIANVLRLIIISNERWVIPATEDERRFFVLDVGDGRRRDVKFFRPLVRGMKAGGDRLFLTYLMERDVSAFDPFNAPATEALTEQKHQSLDPFKQWWFNCIAQARMIGSPIGYFEFKTIPADTLYSSFINWCRSRNIRSRLPDDVSIDAMLREIAPSMKKSLKRSGGEYEYRYASDGIERLRKDWERYIGSPMTWGLTIEDGELECLK